MIHTISLREIQTGGNVGLIADIVPPVDLEQEAVRRYVKSGNLDGADKGSSDYPIPPLVNPLLIGSTDKTSIYAGIEYGYENRPEVRDLLTGRVSELLGYLGVEAEIIN